MSELADYLERFRRGAELVAVSITGAAGPEYDFSVSADRWSVRQIMAHLADAELVLGCRLRQVLAEENPTLMAFDQNAWAENLDYARRKPSQALESFRRLRAENFELLKDLPESLFARSGTHSQRGPLTLLQLLKLYAEHAEKHAQQLVTVRQQYKQSRAAAK